MMMAGVPISIRILSSPVLSQKVSIVELLARYQNKNIYSYGVSLISKDIAYAKCVAEIVERIYIPNFDEGGIGVGFDKEKAQLSALYELIERDAFMPYFLLADLPIKRIEAKIILNELIKLGIKRLPVGYLYIFFDITNDLQIPSIVAVICEKKTGILGVGIKSNANPIAALIGSLEEALLEITLKNSYGKKMNNETVDTISTKHFKSLFMHEKKQIISPLPTKNSNSSLKNVQTYLRKNGQSIVYKEIAPPFLKNSGYYVIRASSNTLQKMFFSEGKKEINNKRLENIKRYYTIMKQNYEKNSGTI